MMAPGHRAPAIIMAVAFATIFTGAIPVPTAFVESEAHRSSAGQAPTATECFAWGKLAPASDDITTNNRISQLNTVTKRQMVRAWSEGGSVIMLGGCDASGDPTECFGDVWAFDLANRLWMPRRLANIASHKTPLLRAASPAWTYDMQLKTLYVFGGAASEEGRGSQTLTTISHARDAGTETGEPRVLPGDPLAVPEIPYVYSRVACTGSVPPPVQGASLELVRVGSGQNVPLLVLFGGYSDGIGSTSSVFVTPVHSSSCAWENPGIGGDPRAPAPRYGQATAVSGNVIYIFGGTDNTRTFADLYALHVTGNPAGIPANPGIGGLALNWHRLAADIPAGVPGGPWRSAFASLAALPTEDRASGGVLIAFGGCEPTANPPVCSNNLGFYSLKLKTWTSPPKSLIDTHGDAILRPSPRGGHTVVWLRDAHGAPTRRMAIVGGCALDKQICYGTEMVRFICAFLF